MRQTLLALHELVPTSRASLFCCKIGSITFQKKIGSITLQLLQIYPPNYICDFTHFFAAPAPIKLPQGFSFKHEVENEKKEILRSLPPYHCREFKKEA